MQSSLNFFDVLSAVLVGNSAIVAMIFAFMRLRQKDQWDWYSAGSMIYFGAILMMAGYFAT